MAGRHRKDTGPAIPPWGRIVVYALALVLPFGALTAGQITGEQTVAAAVTLVAAVGPVLAITYTPTGDDDQESKQ